MFKRAVKNLSNIPGWHTKRKIIVIESDDWGSIRMPSKKVYDALLKSGIPVDTNYFTKFDSLEQNEDLELLFDSLTKFKDRKNRHPLFTALCLVANPDFSRIKKEDFKTYYYEKFTKTCEEYNNSGNVLNLWKEGRSIGVFEPQFHGREHLNINRWMKGLNSDLPTTKLTFNMRLTGLHAHIAKEERGDYQAAFDIDDISELSLLEEVLQDGLTLFKNFMNYNASYFCPTNGPFNYSLNELLGKNKIELINSSKIQREPLGEGNYAKHFNFLGKKEKNGLMFMTRNAFFEPSAARHADTVDNALHSISNAFLWRKPAILSTHRVNYMGRIVKTNRVDGLKQLEILLTKVLKKWPDVEFMSTSELGRLIHQEKGLQVM